MRAKRRRWTMVAAGLLALAGLASEARADLGELGEALRVELGLTRQAVSLEEALGALEHEQAGAEHTAALLEHAGRESLRLLDAYGTGRAERERVARLRARAMVKASRGGIARLVFEDVDEDDPRSADRLEQGRDLRWLVRYDLHELGSYQRSEVRARAELLQAYRQLQSLSVLATVHAVQDDLVAQARQATRPALGRAHAKSSWLLSRAPTRLRTDEDTQRWLAEIEQGKQALQRLQRGDETIRRPVGGRVVGAFGEYTDPVLRMPMIRNGIELAAKRDELVRAPAEGKVVMVATLPGFEEVVVIDHGAGRMTMLGRLWKTTVSEGDTVERGQPLASAAPKIVDDGLGNTVYVELRLGDKPVDPAPLLRW